MNLTVDIGNTRTKIAVFNGEQFVCEEKFEEAAPQHLLDMVALYSPDKLAYCSVGSGQPAFETALQEISRKKQQYTLAPKCQVVLLAKHLGLLEKIQFF